MTSQHRIDKGDIKDSRSPKFYISFNKVLNLHFYIYQTFFLYPVGAQMCMAPHYSPLISCVGKLIPRLKKILVELRDNAVWKPFLLQHHGFLKVLKNGDLTSLVQQEADGSIHNNPYACQRISFNLDVDFFDLFLFQPTTLIYLKWISTAYSIRNSGYIRWILKHFINYFF